MTASRFAPPRFEPVLVDDHLKDGYWIDAVDINGDGRPDLVASGLAVGEVVWYENPNEPKTRADAPWRRHLIHKFEKPVAMDHFDVDGDGRPNLVVCHDYGKCMYNCGPGDGRISWVRNPGSYGPDAVWERRHVGELVATHRLRFGRFTQSDTPEILALPVVGPRGGPDAVHKPVRCTLFTPPHDVLNAERWAETVVDDSSFRIIHDVVVDRFGANGEGARDSVMLATEEGISWFYCGPQGAWHHRRLARGELTEVGVTGFKGTGNLALGRIGDDPYAYIATVEPFHGNTVCVYVKDPRASLTEVSWRRTVLDVFGDPNEAGEGPGHHVVAADFDGDGDDEFLVALRGPMPWQGVFYYKCVDLESAAFVKYRVSTSSAARIALADFDGDGRIDFATTGYYTPGYFLCDRPQVNVFLNRVGDGA